jgi:DNA polymerase III sliding clamp (beta) subunit (PCNA family)
MNIQSLNALIQAFNAASDDVTRYHLNYVYLSAKGEFVRFRATEGHMLADFTVGDPELAKLIGDNVYAVSRESLPALKAIAKQYKNMEIHCEIGTANRLVFGKAEVSGCTVEIRTAKETGVEFPDTDGLWPRYNEEPTQIGLNPDLLMDLVKAMREDKRHNIQLVIKDKTAPIIVKCGERKGILMPVRIETETYCEPSKAKASA